MESKIWHWVYFVFAKKFWWTLVVLKRVLYKSKSFLSTCIILRSWAPEVCSWLKMKLLGFLAIIGEFLLNSEVFKIDLNTVSSTAVKSLKKQISLLLSRKKSYGGSCCTEVEHMPLEKEVMDLISTKDRTFYSLLSVLHSILDCLLNIECP